MRKPARAVHRIAHVVLCALHVPHPKKALGATCQRLRRLLHATCHIRRLIRMQITLPMRMRASCEDFFGATATDVLEWPRVFWRSILWQLPCKVRTTGVTAVNHCALFPWVGQ